MSKNINLTQGTVLSSLIKFTIPILLTILLQMTYGTADLLIVGRFSTVADVSGVAIGSQLMYTVTSFFTGISMGTTVLIARYIGSNNKENIAKVIGTSIVVFGLLSVVVTFVFIVMNQEIVVLMKTPTESLSQTKSYLFFCSLGIVFIAFYNLLGSVFRGIGDSKTPLLTVFIACIANIILDFIFVAGFKMGATGAALATTMAQASSVIISLIIIKKRKLPFNFSKKDILYDEKYTKKLFKIGIPVALQGVLLMISFLVVTSIINAFGVAASAAVGIVEKITGIIMVVPLAFMQSLLAFSAQNIGAGQKSRAKKALLYSIMISLIFGVVMAYLSAFHGTIFTKLFTNDIETTMLALEYLKSYSFDCIFVAAMFSFSGYFSGCGKTTFVMLQSVLGSFLIRIPLAYYFSTLEDTSLFIIGLATPSSTAIQIIACIIYYIYTQKDKPLQGIHHTTKSY